MCNGCAQVDIQDKNNKQIMENVNKIEVLNEIWSMKDVIFKMKGGRNDIIRMYRLYNSYFNENLQNMDNGFYVEHVARSLFGVCKQIEKGQISLVKKVEVVEQPKEVVKEDVVKTITEHTIENLDKIVQDSNKSKSEKLIDKLSGKYAAKKAKKNAEKGV